MKKIFAIIIIVFLFACKNDDEKTETLDFCLSQSENIINDQNISLLKKLERIAINDPLSSMAKFQYQKANEAYNLGEDLKKRL